MQAFIVLVKFMHIHILGICGTFMGGIAVLAKAAGHRVTGCDANVYPPMSTQLEAQNDAAPDGACAAGGFADAGGVISAFTRAGTGTFTPGAR